VTVDNETLYVSAGILHDDLEQIAHHLYVANLINWYHAVPQPNPPGNVLRARIEKELDL
jgi:hypothetical protein